MGANLVAQAYQRWAHIDDRPFRVLVKMALTAKDKPTPDVAAGLYFGGHVGLVPALAYKPGTKHDSKLRAVRDAVAVLEALGAVVCTKQAMSGDNAIYKLTLDAEAKPAPPKRKGSNNFAPQAEHATPTQTINQAEERPPTEAEHATPPPYKEEETPEETPEELKEESGLDLRTELAVTRANTSAQTSDSLDACSDPTCTLGYLYDSTQPKGRRNIPCPVCRPEAKILPFARRRAQWPTSQPSASTPTSNARSAAARPADTPALAPPPSSSSGPPSTTQQQP